MKWVVVFFAVLVCAVGASSPVMAQTNYPLGSAIELRDANGNLITSTTPTCPEDGINVHSTGWLATSSVHATFHSDPVDLGNHAADANGVVDFFFRVSQVENGMHTLRLEGLGANGQPRVIEAAILCECKPSPSAPSAVLGQTLDNVAGSAGTTTSRGVSGFFAKTGLDVTTLLAVALDLVLIGIVLRLAQTRQSVGGWLSTSSSARSRGSQ
jgi:hypothetical protein